MPLMVGAWRTRAVVRIFSVALAVPEWLPTAVATTA
jgi:hypothetical protein